MAFERDSVLGMDCPLVYNTGTHATPVWNVMPRAMDVEITPFGKGKAEQKIKGSKYNFKRGTFIELGVSFGYEYEPGGGDEDYPVLLDSMLNNTPIEIWVPDGPVGEVGSQGIRMVVEVFEFPLSHKLEEAATLQIAAEITRVKEAGVVIEPDWYEVEA